MSEVKITPLTCPSCGARIRIPEGANHFTCGYCGNDHLVEGILRTQEPKPALRKRIAMPESVKVGRDGGVLSITQRWFSWKYIPALIFVIAWDGFLVFWYTMAFATGAPLIFKLFPFVHVTVGVVLTYSTIAGLVNRTTVELTQDELSIWYEPMPWPGEKKLKTCDIRQLFCKEKVSRSRNGTSYTYHLYAITQEDRQIKLATKLESPAAALFFEQQLEDWLHIVNEPVEGELDSI